MFLREDRVCVIEFLPESYCFHQKCIFTIRNHIEGITDELQPEEHIYISPEEWSACGLSLFCETQKNKKPIFSSPPRTHQVKQRTVATECTPRAHPWALTIIPLRVKNSKQLWQTNTGTTYRDETTNHKDYVSFWGIYHGRQWSMTNMKKNHDQIRRCQKWYNRGLDRN